MLGTASLFGGFSLMPALATHDSDAVELATEEITQEDDESVVIDAVELNAKKLTSRVAGTVTIEIIQDGDVLESASFGTADLKTSFSAVEVDVTNINVTGSFEILAEFVGSGVVTVSGIGIVEGTEVADNGGNGGNNNDDDAGNENPSPPQEEELENVIATKTIAQDDDESMTVEVVEFNAKKLKSSVAGTVTVALVQDGVVLDQETFSASSLKTSYVEMEATFDEEITGDFDVVFMFEGSGMVYVSGINVPGSTQTVENPPTDPPTPPSDPSGTVQLTVESVDEAGNEIVGMWIEVYSGMSASGEPIFEGETPETFELDAGEYIVAVADFENNIFQRWADSAHDRTREATLTQDETFTAVYSTDGTAPPGQSEPPTTSPPPTSEDGTITVYAYRIPSSNWGDTFTGANAAMWFVLYNSTGWIVHSGFYDENGSTVTGLNNGETYYVYATDCNECHGDPHNVEFRHWHDGSTERQRPVMTGDSAHAYYEFVPPS